MVLRENEPTTEVFNPDLCAPQETSRSRAASVLRGVDPDGVRRRTPRGAQMAGFLDNFRWPECECIDWGERRNAVASVAAGVLVSESRGWIIFKFSFIHKLHYVFC